MAEDLFQLGDLADDVDDALAVKAQRKREAFLLSKISYATEEVVVGPGWFLNHSEIISEPISDKVLAAVALDLQYQYFNSNYQDALSISSKVSCEISKIQDLSEYSGSLKEVLDIGLRCCIKLNRPNEGRPMLDLAIKLPRKTSGFSATIAKAYILCQMPREAVSATLRALKEHPQFFPYLELLSDAFNLWSQREAADSPSSQTSAARSLASLLRVASVSSRKRHSFRDAALTEDTVTRKAPQYDPAQVAMEEGSREIPDMEAIQSWVSQLGLTAEESQEAVQLCEYASGRLLTNETEGTGTRSVRTL